MFCNKCGKPTADDDLFCRFCGNRLSVVNQEKNCGFDPLFDKIFSENESTQKIELDNGFTVYQSKSKQKFDVNKCSVCGGTMLTKTGLFNYMCEYCGSKFTVNENNDIIDSKLTQAEILDVFQKAAHLENSGQYVDELQLFLKHQSQASDNVLFLVKLGRAYRHCGMYDKAIEVYKNAISVDPSFGSSYANIGAVYIFTGQYRLAEENLLKGLKLMSANTTRNTKSDFAVVHSNLALAVGHQGRKQEAKRYLEIAEKQYGYPNGARVRELIGIKKGLFR